MDALTVTPSDDSIPTPYGDVWFETGIGGERIPMYSDRLAEAAAVEAYLRGDYGSLLSEEITFIREAEREMRESLKHNPSTLIPNLT